LSYIFNQEFTISPGISYSTTECKIHRGSDGCKQEEKISNVCFAGRHLFDTSNSVEQTGLNFSITTCQLLVIVKQILPEIEGIFSHIRKREM